VRHVVKDVCRHIDLVATSWSGCSQLWWQRNNRAFCLTGFVSTGPWKPSSHILATVASVRVKILPIKQMTDERAEISLCLPEFTKRVLLHVNKVGIHIYLWLHLSSKQFTKTQPPLKVFYELWKLYKLSSNFNSEKTKVQCKRVFQKYKKIYDLNWTRV